MCTTSVIQNKHHQQLNSSSRNKNLSSFEQLNDKKKTECVATMTNTLGHARLMGMMCKVQISSRTCTSKQTDMNVLIKKTNKVEIDMVFYVNND